MRILTNKIGFIDAFFFVEYQLTKRKDQKIKGQFEIFEYLNNQVEFIYGQKTFTDFNEFNKELEKITQIELLSDEGFSNAYFNILPKFNTSKDAFLYLNEHVELIHGKTFYKDFNDFKLDV